MYFYEMFVYESNHDVKYKFVVYMNSIQSNSQVRFHPSILESQWAETTALVRLTNIRLFKTLDINFAKTKQVS